MESGAENPCRLISASAAERIRVRTHEPANRRNLAYLAASEEGEPILLNRMLTDANVVLPVGFAQPDRATGYYGIHTILYPEFSDIKTQARFRRHDRFGDNARHRQLRHEVNHVAWLLGVNFTVRSCRGRRRHSACAGRTERCRAAQSAASCIGLPGPGRSPGARSW